MRLMVLAACVLALGAAGCGDDGDADSIGLEPEDSVTFDLEEQNDSGITDARATLTPVDDTTTNVLVEFTENVEASGDQPHHPAHVHEGSCDDLNPTPAYPLVDVSGGKSESRLDVGLEDLLDGDYAINVHESPENADVYIACGDIPDE